MSAVLAEGHTRNTQGSNVTTLLSVGFRGCFTFISSETSKVQRDEIPIEMSYACL